MGQGRGLVDVSSTALQLGIAGARLPSCGVCPGVRALHDDVEHRILDAVVTLSVVPETRCQLTLEGFVGGRR